MRFVVKLSTTFVAPALSRPLDARGSVLPVVSDRQRGTSRDVHPGVVITPNAAPAKAEADLLSAFQYLPSD